MVSLVPQRKREVERAKEAKEAAERASMAAAMEASGNGTPLDDPVAEKKRLQALQEKADLELATEALGLGGGAGAGSGGVAQGARALLAALPLPAGDAEAFRLVGAEVAARVAAASGRSSAPALAFIKEALREACEKILTLEDIGQLATLVQVQSSKKKAAQKAAAPGKGRSSASAKKVHVGRDDDYADYDDYGDLDVAAKPGKAAATSVAAPAPASSAGASASAAAAYAAAASSLDGDFM